MIKGIYTAARALEYRKNSIDVIANNLANVNTTGYKREVPFSEVINKMGDVQTKRVTNQSQGDLSLTANPLDFAITGLGFFALKNDQGGIQLTRNGRFKISDEGFLTDGTGNRVLGKNGPIEMEATMFDQNSTIHVTNNGEIKIGEKIIDTLLIMNVENSNELSRSGQSNFTSENQEYFTLPEDKYTISQGYLEGANTNIMEEMSAMIQLNKEYESAQKIISTLDHTLGKANEIGTV